jgi:hypothetical protein
MTHSGYGRMELFRLAPSTGDVLRRLNVFQGQIIHGKVYKSEAVIPQEGVNPDSGIPAFISKIALGSHMIEVGTDIPLENGAKVVFEVLRIGDDNFMLELLKIDSTPVDRSAQDLQGRATDAVDWSENVVLSDIEKSGDTNSIRVSPKIQDTGVLTRPDLTALPKPAANVIRAAINLGFIDAATYSVKSPAIRTYLHNVAEDILVEIDRLVESARTQPEVIRGDRAEFLKLSESIKSIIETIRPVISSIQSKIPELTDSTVGLIRDLVAAVSILKSAQSPIPQASIQSPIGTISDTPAQAGQPQTSVGAHQTTNSVPEQASANSGTPATQNPLTPTGDPSNAPVSTSPAPTVVQAALSSTGHGPQGVTPQSADPVYTGDSPQKLPDSIRTGGIPVEITMSGQNHVRDIVLGLRTLTSLINKLVSNLSQSVESNARLSAVIAKATSAADALEGTVLAPALSRSADAAGAVPRINLPVEIPGGSSNVLILQPAGEYTGKKPGQGNEKLKTESETGHNIGLIQLYMENLGSVRIRVDVKRQVVRDEIRTGVSGRFHIDKVKEDHIGKSLKSLELAMEARGFRNDGFVVIRVSNDRAEESAGNNNLTKESGLDIKA